MKLRKYTQGITIFTTPEMYQEVKSASDQMQISLSELFRKIIRQYLDYSSGNNSEKANIKNSTL
jgi:metal-responsive CopG/Arc/MetJ family transcriptional regulator